MVPYSKIHLFCHMLRQRYALLLLGLILLVTGRVDASDEFQFRFNSTLAVEMAKKWKGTAGIESRYDESGHQVKNHADLGVVYTGIAQWFDIGLNYRTIFSRLQTDLEQDQWLRENRMYLNFLMRHRIKEVGFNHRIRLEYSTTDRIADFGTIRYRVGINPPVEYDPSNERLILRNYTVRPYGNYELAVNSTDYHTGSHSFTAGLSAQFSDRIFGNFYYLREENRTNQDDYGINVVGIDLKLLF